MGQRAGGSTANGQSQVRAIAAPMPRTAKVIRMGVMAGTLLDEVRRPPLDQAGRARMRESFDASVGELSGCLPAHLAAELGRLAPTFTTKVPSQAELRIAQAQLAGWLEGLLQNLRAIIDAATANNRTLVTSNEPRSRR
jgi:hypothetical protein